MVEFARKILRLNEVPVEDVAVTQQTKTTCEVLNKHQRFFANGVMIFVMCNEGESTQDGHVIVSLQNPRHVCHFRNA